MTNVEILIAKEKKYGLVERTALFSEKNVKFLKGVEKNEITKPLINQVVRLATSREIF